MDPFSGPTAPERLARGGLTASVGKNRIALISPAGMLGQIVLAALEHDPEVDLVLVPTGSPQQPSALEQPKVDLLILIVPARQGVSECREMLSRFPGLRALAVLEDD